MGTLTPVTVARIEDALASSWRDKAREQGAAQPHDCALTLLVWVDEERAGSDVFALVKQLAGKHPIRALVLSAIEDTREAGVSAFIATGCQGQKGEVICSEEILLRASADAPELLVSAVRGLLVPDLPVYLWWRSGSLHGNLLFSELRKLADRIVVDSIRFGDGPAALDTLRRLVHHSPAQATVRDLNWQRTEPWRNAIAACFDDRAIMALLSVFDRGSITYASSGEASASARSLLMQGWLASRFPPLRGHIKIAPGRHWKDIAQGRLVAVTLSSSSCKSSLMLVRQHAPTSIAAEAHTPDGSLLKRWDMPAATRAEAELLDRCIDALGRDAIFEAALGME